MPDPAKVKVAIVGSVLVIGASIGLGLGLTRNKSNGAIVENQNMAVPQKEVVYKDPSPTKKKDILDELELNAASRYSSYSGSEYIDYGSDPLGQDVMETKERSYDDDHWEDHWEDDGWDDDGWKDVSFCDIFILHLHLLMCMR